MAKRSRLIAARGCKGWSLENAAEHIGVSVNTLNKWELGKAAPYAYNVAKLCEVYGSSTEELGLEIDIVETSDTNLQNMQGFIDKDLSTQLQLITCSTQSYLELQSAIIQEIQATSETEQRTREAIRRLATFPLILNTGSRRPTKEVLLHCAAGIIACGYLSDGSDAKDMRLAFSALNAYLVAITNIIRTKPSKIATDLAAQCLQLKQRLAYHIESTLTALIYAEQAAQYAVSSDNRATQVMALRELASVYEWPLPGMQPDQRRKKALDATTQAVALLKNQGKPVSSLIQFWLFTGHAKFQGLNRLKQETLTSLNKAQEAFVASVNDDPIPGFELNKGNLIRQRGIAYAYLGDQPRALETFASIIDLNDENVGPRIPMKRRLHVGTLSEAMFASLKVPNAQKDKELSLRLFKAELNAAKRIQSETYFSEAEVAYQIMQAVWADDPMMRDLGDLLVHW